jgi:hypothetical protein
LTCERLNVSISGGCGAHRHAQRCGSFRLLLHRS